MEKRPISELLETTMQKVRETVDANTIIGDQITTPDGITLIPVSKLSFGFAGGGSDAPSKQDQKNAFGGGIGAGVNITPVAFIVVKDGNVKLLYVAPPNQSTLDKVLDTAPDLVDKITGFIKSRKESAEDGDDGTGEEQ